MRSRNRWVSIQGATCEKLLELSSDDRAAASLPFFYWRPDFEKNAGAKPAPVIDLGATSRDIWGTVAGTLTQTLALDPKNDPDHVFLGDSRHVGTLLQGVMANLVIHTLNARFDARIEPLGAAHPCAAASPIRRASSIAERISTETPALRSTSLMN